MNIGERIKEARLNTKMTQDDLAKELNVSRSTVANWESGRNNPDVESLIKIADILKVPIKSLLKENGSILNKLTFTVVITILAILLMLVVMFKTNKMVDISNPDFISDAIIHKNELIITTDLPFYQSLEASSGGISFESSDAIQLNLIAKTDFTLKNNNKLTYKLDKYFDENQISKLKKIYIMYQGQIIKVFEIKYTGLYTVYAAL